MSAPLLEVKGISKRFPGVVALDSVDLEVGQGEIVGLIGENGAGKSTLMKILGGIHQADVGTLRFDSRSVAIRSVADAFALGIRSIHQELNVLENLDVAANIFLGCEPVVGGPLKLLNRREMVRASERYLRKMGLEISGRTPLRELSLAHQQMVEIAKALSQNARLLVMDEPTSCLTLSETERLLAKIRELRAEGVSIIYITHRLVEVGECADRVVVLRDGKNAGALRREEITHDNMVRLMVGRDLQNFYVHPEGWKRPDYFQVRDLRTRAHPKCTVSFNAAAGEILGFAGLVGAGRSEMAQAIFGVIPPLEGAIFLDGQPVTIRRSREAISHGIYLVPEDRRRTGLITEMTVTENITLPGLKLLARLGWINSQEELNVASQQCEALRVKTPSLQAKVMNLSGGNQQKVVLGKWLALKPKVLVFDEPTRGIDVGAKAEIYRLMRDLAENGVALIMISSDMEEVLGVSDRVAVMHEGSIAGIFERHECTEEAIMHLAVGKTDRREAA